MLPNEFWQQIKDTLPLNGVTDNTAGLISYRSQISNRRWVLIDVDRSLETPTTLQVISQRSDLTSNSTGTGPGPVDYI